jgi:multidrug efflux system membrane fusion protein
MITSRTYRKLFYLATVISLAGIGACNKPLEEQADIVRPIKMMTVQGGGACRTQEYSGQIASTSTADIGFEVSGRIVEFMVRDGQEVEEGATLAKLDPADYQSGVNQAEADYRAAETNFHRYEELVETGAVSRQALDRSRRNFEVSAAALETARKALAEEQRGRS